MTHSGPSPQSSDERGHQPAASPPAEPASAASPAAPSASPHSAVSPLSAPALDDTHSFDRPSMVMDPDPSLGYATFDASELAVVLSHYDLGIIQAVREYRRGSRHSPKLLIKSEKGGFILKRRAHGRDDPIKVAFTHQIQRTLARGGYPLPRLVLTRGGTESMLSVGGRMYELFEYISGQPYDHSLHATFEAGQALALFHRVLASEKPAWEPSTGSFHRSPHLVPNLAYIPHRLRDETLTDVCESLRDSYLRAGDKVEELGISAWPRQIVHGDWHPGNMLFRGSKIVAVIDYDTARVQQRVLDIANGALQFSITRLAGAPETWPSEPDEGRLKRFCRGYDSMAEAVISRDELAAIPWLTIEALVAEAALPIAATGRFGRLEASGVLKMVERKVRWMQTHVARIAQLVT